MKCRFNSMRRSERQSTGVVELKRQERDLHVARNYLHCHCAPRARPVKLHEEDALPGPQNQTAFMDRDHKIAPYDPCG